MRCPSCGNKGKPDSRPRPGEPPAFEFRGRLGGKIIVRCLRCSRGVFVRAFPPGYKAIPAGQWSKLDAFWEMRRAEILADLKARLAQPESPMSDEVAQSQMVSLGTMQRQTAVVHAMEQAGYRSSESVNDLLQNRRAEAALIALTAHQGSVIHDGYEEFLALGGVPQTERAARLVELAKDALAHGELSVKAFLEDTGAPHM